MSTEWLIDANGNRASIAYFGSTEAAQAALDGLNGCRNCTNCSRCSDCSDCSYCSDCSRCSDCSYCSRCSYCSYCSRCSDCSYCSYCSRCSDCSGCSRCSYCSRCSGCSYCSRCSDCSDCSGCSDCSDCSEERGGSNVEAGNAPPIPRIDNIHRQVYGAVTRPNALDMTMWHTCETTHCRAGWVVTLAGEPGKALEQFYGTGLAARLIYRESGYRINPARFYDNDSAALEDMRKLAEES